MANAESLKGKEYIDFLLKFLKSKQQEEGKEEEKGRKKREQVCFQELTKEECQKLSDTLEAEDMIYYFNVNDGCKVLVDSLYISTTGLKLIQDLLEKNVKLRDDF